MSLITEEKKYLYKKYKTKYLDYRNQLGGNDREKQIVSLKQQIKTLYSSFNENDVKFILERFTAITNNNFSPQIAFNMIKEYNPQYIVSDIKYLSSMIINLFNILDGIKNNEIRSILTYNSINAMGNKNKDYWSEDREHKSLINIHIFRKGTIENEEILKDMTIIDFDFLQKPNHIYNNYGIEQFNRVYPRLAKKSSDICKYLIKLIANGNHYYPYDKDGTYKYIYVTYNDDILIKLCNEFNTNIEKLVALGVNQEKAKKILYMQQYDEDAIIEYYNSLQI